MTSQLNTYYDLAATSGVTGDLRTRIAEATERLEQLKALDSAVEPEPISTEEVKAARGELYRLAQSRDPEAAQLILKQFVVELTADSKKKTVEGTLRDPRLLGASCMAAPRGDGVSRTRYVHLHLRYLGGDKFRVKTERLGPPRRQGCSVRAG